MAETLTESTLTAEERAYFMSLINQSDTAHGMATAPKKPKDSPWELKTQIRNPSVPPPALSVAALGWKTAE